MELTDEQVKERVHQILEENQFTQQRANKMDIDDFLKLLVAFNKAQIHFS